MTLVGGEGSESGVITNDVLKFRKIIEFESSCTVICLIVNGKRVKN